MVTLFDNDDLLDSLLDDKKQPAKTNSNHNLPTNRSSAADNIFSMLAEEVKQDGADSENSDVSEVDPNEILKNMKGIDDMDDDLFKMNRSSAPAKSNGKDGPKKSATTLENNDKAGGDKSSIGQKKSNSAPSSGRNYKNFTFSDVDDPLDDLLPDEPKSKTKAVEKSVPSPVSPILKSKLHFSTTKKRSDLTFDDSKDDLMDALGFDNDQNRAQKKDAPLWDGKERSDQPQRARTKVDDILQSLTSPHLLERPPTGEKKEQQPDKSTALKEKQDDDLTFGSYQPTVVSTPEGRQSRRQSVRFSTEDVSVSTLDKKTKPTTPTRQRPSAEWLGLKTDDGLVQDRNDHKSETENVSSNPASGAPLERRASVPGPVKSAADTQSPAHKGLVKPAKSEVSVSQERNEEDDWLSGALCRKRALSGARHEAKTQMTRQEDSLEVMEKLDVKADLSKQVTSHAPRIRDDSAPSLRELSRTSPGESGPAAHSTPIRDETTKQSDRSMKEFQSTPTPIQQQLILSSDNLQMLLQQQQQQLQQQQQQQQQVTQPPLLGLGGHVPAGFVDHQSFQGRVLQLEGQMKTLQMERDQSQLLLENIQLRHKQDMELVENAHKARVKLLEDSAAQRETRLRQECEDWMERLDALTRSTEQERSELRAQHQRKLAQAHQERDREVERLRELQRKSILEMKKDHEDQIHRLKKLKDEEIDAVTSATSETRSLSAVIEQMEQFSSRLGELSCRVESTHENTAQGLEQGARHRDEQLRILQDRLAQQQKAMSDEKVYLKEIISRMDTQINEQQRQLEKERWKVTSEQAKAESTQRALEDERRSHSMQMNMEREELERAKSALLKEQKSVMQHCTEERRKLAAEWAGFHAQEKQRHDRAEREVSSLLEKREGSIISMAQEQADLKLRTAELKQKELAVAQERDNLNRLREELEREKERISATALRLKTRVQEVEAFSKLAADKFEEGERALHEARLVEAEHEARLGHIQSQTEKLRQQEHRILQERMQFNTLQKEQPRQLFPIVSQVETPVPDFTPLLPNSKLAPTLITPNVGANSESTILQASLALWKYTAAKDRECLEDEKVFLESLKKKSYA
ncbi:fas-binding factor 1 homolog [Eucyclogobius newberryi]|uniref:fas-binding factor 1 homolog n=1 Tax=Eucyclogobius newberryi TaxID=166745 RepID=UPI003B59EDCD